MFIKEEERYKQERLNKILSLNERYEASLVATFQKRGFTLKGVIGGIISFIIGLIFGIIMGIIIAAAFNLPTIFINIFAGVFSIGITILVVMVISKKTIKPAFIAVTQKHLNVACFLSDSYKEKKENYSFKFYLIENLKVRNYKSIYKFRNGDTYNKIIKFKYLGVRFKIKIPDALNQNELAEEEIIKLISILEKYTSENKGEKAITSIKHKNDRLSEILIPNESYEASVYAVFQKRGYLIIVIFLVAISFIFSLPAGVFIGISIHVVLNLPEIFIYAFMIIFSLGIELLLIFTIAKYMIKATFVGITQKHLCVTFVKKTDYKLEKEYRIFKLDLIEDLKITHHFHNYPTRFVSGYIDAYEDRVIRFKYQGKMFKMRIPGEMRPDSLSSEDRLNILLTGERESIDKVSDSEKETRYMVSNLEKYVKQRKNK